jgi:acetoin utilization deacetylase AcuC-like enzyme
VAYPEVPGRVERVLEGIRLACEIDLRETRELAVDGVRALHDEDYVTFLLEMAESLNEGEEYIPSIFHPDLSRGPLEFRGGMFTAEIGTPIGPATIEAALNSAAAAEEAARVAVRDSRHTVALCRPPGHHATRRRYGGYCFFNNAYLAARVLSGSGRCAVVDVDYHLGDGSLDFATESTPYFSLHADPWLNYPHAHAGLDSEKPGAYLRTLPDGTDSAGYLKVLDESLETLKGLRPDYVVLSLGFDALGTDEIQDARVDLRPEDYGAIGQRIADLPCRVVVLLEGGYDLDSLDACAAHFFRGFTR